MKETDFSIRDGEKNVYFAAVNSGRGFISYYGDVFGDPRIKKRYIIKGRPGTGKSSFIRKAARCAETKGRRVVYYPCASDPDSLDGVIIDGTIALLDGTAPHLYEPRIPGAADEIVNLGEFWNADELYARYDEIAYLTNMKGEAYSRAYKFLSAAMNVAEINRSLVKGALLRDKMKGAVARLFRCFPDGDGFSVENGSVNAIGMKGRAHLDTYERSAEKLYLIYDSFGFGKDLLLEIIDAAREKKIKVRVSHSPLDPDLPDAVFLYEIGVAFVLSDGDAPENKLRINVKRFVDVDAVDKIKTEYRCNRRLCEALITSAEESLRDGGRFHFALEHIYSSCMDFAAEERFAESFCNKLFGRVQ